jgi:hypothetical protein
VVLIPRHRHRIRDTRQPGNINPAIVVAAAVFMSGRLCWLCAGRRSRIACGDVLQAAAGRTSFDFSPQSDGTATSQRG